MAVVSLFATCVLDAHFPAVGEAVVAVLERSGWTVVLRPEQTCCGLPLWHEGRLEEARALGRRQVEVLGSGDEPVVVPSSACALHLTQTVPRLLDSERPELRAGALQLAGRVRDFASFVTESVSGGRTEAARGGGEVRQPAPPGARTIAHQPGCALLRGLGRGDAPARALAAAGCPWVPLGHPEECCGFGGGLPLHQPDVAARLADEKLAEAGQSGCATLTVDDVGCLLHLSGRARERGCAVRVRHLAEVLAEAGDRGEP
jgi:L-lactate dehydrogenase complex protein LldE